MEHHLGYGTVTSYPLWDGVCVALGIQLSHSLYLNVKDMYSCPCMARHIWRQTGSPVVSCVVEAGAQGRSRQTVKPFTSIQHQRGSQMPPHLPSVLSAF